MKYHTKGTLRRFWDCWKWHGKNMDLSYQSVDFWAYFNSSLTDSFFGTGTASSCRSYSIKLGRCYKMGMDTCRQSSAMPDSK